MGRSRARLNWLVKLSQLNFIPLDVHTHEIPEGEATTDGKTFGPTFAPSSLPLSEHAYLLIPPLKKIKKITSPQIFLKNVWHVHSQSKVWFDQNFNIKYVKKNQPYQKCQEIHCYIIIIRKSCEQFGKKN